MPSAAGLEPFRPAARAPRANESSLYPLDYAYALAGLAAPTARVIAPDDMPEPYRALLAHEADMTQTLERHVDGRLAIRPLTARVRGRWYLRRVLLVQASSGRPVGMGAVRLALDVVNPRVRSLIIRGEIPLGRILREARVPYRRRPRRFLAITPNPEMMGVFWMREPETLYGRQTVLTLNGARIGQVLDVLPLV